MFFPFYEKQGRKNHFLNNTKLLKNFFLVLENSLQIKKLVGKIKKWLDNSFNWCTYIIIKFNSRYEIKIWEWIKKHSRLLKILLYKRICM